MLYDAATAMFHCMVCCFFDDGKYCCAKHPFWIYVEKLKLHFTKPEQSRVW